ncbi:10095_t:CDS:1 [Funneliformis caledonium]|uniref:10095_t:CDS:1 n=1 Tax=Funneliformis caledonium TaxID=1117310 RepID=A0A9N9C263_9GLOM|nr:10095_t:CDS:1 [Funneliformis caledonium]
MPKIRKPTNKNHIDSKVNNNKETNIDYNYVLKPAFPSSLSLNDIISVIKAPNNNKKAKTFPNAFITYKKALIKENRNRNIKLPPMGQLSKIASCYWDEEPENVKAFYSKLSEEAKSLYKLENPIQILFDKNMNEVEVSRVINKAGSNYVNYIQGNEDPVENMQSSTNGYLPIEDNSASVTNFFLDNNYINSSQASFPNSNFFEDPYLMNQVPNDQEDIKMLECESVQFSPLQVDSDYVTFTQGFEVPVEDIIFTPNSYPLIEDYSTCNNREYGMEHIFTDFLLVENNQKNVSTYGADSNYINYGTEEVLPVEM